MATALVVAFPVFLLLLLLGMQRWEDLVAGRRTPESPAAAVVPLPPGPTGPAATPRLPAAG